MLTSFNPSLFLPSFLPSPLTCILSTLATTQRTSVVRLAPPPRRRACHSLHINAAKEPTVRKGTSHLSPRRFPTLFQHDKCEDKVVLLPTGGHLRSFPTLLSAISFHQVLHNLHPKPSQVFLTLFFRLFARPFLSFFFHKFLVFSKCLPSLSTALFLEQLPLLKTVRNRNFRSLI